MKTRVKELEKIDLSFARKFNLEVLVLLGSYGTSDFRPGGSDIDLAFLSSVNLDSKERLELINEVSRAFKYSKIDLIDLQKASGLVKFEVATKGRLLFEKTEGFFERYSLYCLRYYYDTLKFRKLREEYFQEQLGVLLNGKN